MTPKKWRDVAKKKTSLVKVTGLSSSTVKILQLLASAMGDLTRLSGKHELRYLKYDARILGKFRDTITIVDVILSNKLANIHDAIDDSMEDA